MTERERWTVIDALRVAADVYREDANGTRKVAPRIADDFDRQADEALRLAIVFEDNEEDL